MSPKDLDAVFYCKDVPQIELRDGMFHVCYVVGGFHAEFVMSPNKFFKALRRAVKAADEFHDGMQNVLGMVAGNDDGE